MILVHIMLIPFRIRQVSKGCHLELRDYHYMNLNYTLLRDFETANGNPEAHTLS